MYLPLRSPPGQETGFSAVIEGINPVCPHVRSMYYVVSMGGPLNRDARDGGWIAEDVDRAQGKACRMGCGWYDTCAIMGAAFLSYLLESTAGIAALYVRVPTCLGRDRTNQWDRKSRCYPVNAGRPPCALCPYVLPECPRTFPLDAVQSTEYSVRIIVLHVPSVQYRLLSRRIP
jgi:hypothetical protein